MSDEPVDVAVILADLAAQIGQYARDLAIERARTAALTARVASLESDST